MKKLLLLTLSILSVQCVKAKMIYVEANSDFSTANPPDVWQVTVTKDVETKQGFVIKAGSVFEGQIKDVKSPKRMKKDASFAFVPIYFYDLDGTRHEIKYNVKAKYSFMEKIRAKNVAKKGVLSAGGLIVPGFGYAVQTVEGIYKNEQGNRFKSGATAFVDSTPISLYKEGKEIEFKKGDIFKMNFTIDDESPENTKNEE